MSRIRRIKIPNIPYHVTQRGNRRQNIFFKPADYRMYLDFLNIAAKAHSFDVLAFCLMTNHVHLLVVPQNENSLSNGIGQVHHSYSKYINSQKNWRGALWQGRFYSNPIQESRLHIVAKYIELNPVRAGLVENAANYPWNSVAIKGASSSYDNQQGHLGKPSLQGSIDLSTESTDKLLFDEIRKSTRVGRVFGSDEYVSQLEKKHGLKLAPKKPGPKSNKKQ